MKIRLIEGSSVEIVSQAEDTLVKVRNDGLIEYPDNINFFCSNDGNILVKFTHDNGPGSISLLVYGLGTNDICAVDMNGDELDRVQLRSAIGIGSQLLKANNNLEDTSFGYLEDVLPNINDYITYNSNTSTYESTAGKLRQLYNKAILCGARGSSNNIYRIVNASIDSDNQFTFELATVSYNNSGLNSVTSFICNCNNGIVNIQSTDF